MYKIFLILCLVSSFLQAESVNPSARFPANKDIRLGFVFSSAAHIVDAEDRSDFADDVYGFGLKHLGGGFHSAIEFVKGFEISSFILLAANSRGKLFSKNTPNNLLTSFLLEGDLAFKYLHTVSDNFDIGGQISFGYSFHFNKNEIQLFYNKDEVGLRMLYIKAGPSARWIIDDKLNFYGTLSYTLGNIGETERSKRLSKSVYPGSNASGIELPLGMVYQFNETLSFFAEVNTAFKDFSRPNGAFQETFNMGLLVNAKK